MSHLLSNSITCLLIDDDEDDQELFSLTLEDLNASIDLQVANNCYEALLLLQQENYPKPDYIFLDLNMPRMGGRECLRQLKNNTALKNIPVVIYSTSEEQKDITDTNTMGAIDFITKPARISELVIRLRDFFNHHQPHLLTPNTCNEK